MEPSRSPTLEEARARMKAHFPDQDAGKGDRWEALWKDQFLPFDRGMPNPALEDTLADRQEILGPSVDSSGKRRTAFVPGCGRGYDVLLLASFGYDAYGLEISETAVKSCEEEKQKNGHKYPTRHETVGAGRAEFINGDFFDDGWLQRIGLDGFDLIYDYTFLCALPPSLRPTWALRMSRLLSRDGHLVCVEFPSNKDPKAGGPPFALPEPVYQTHLAHPGEEIPYLESGHIDQAVDRPTNAAALHRLARWQPARTHEIGKGQDSVSIWAHTDTDTQ